MSFNEEAMCWSEKRHQDFIRRYDLKIELKIHQIYATTTEWEIKFLTDEETEMTKLEQIQNHLAKKAMIGGLKMLTTTELVDYLDVEQLWWQLTSGKAEDYHSFVGSLASIMLELDKRGHKLV